MLYLIGSIILTSYLTLAFKLVERFKLNNLQVIVFNYFTCVITGSIVNGHFPIDSNGIQQPWFKWACLMGIVFISLFNIIAFTAQKLGVAVASVANKLSLVIPFIFSIYLYGEAASVLKIIGVVVALVAVVLTCWPARTSRSDSKKDAAAHQPQNKSLLLIPVILFLGSGLLDTMIKFVEHNFLDGKNNNDYLISAFSSAATIGLILILFLFITGRQKFSYKAVLMGIAIGVPNYFSIWCLMKVLKSYHDNSSFVIPVNNMGIVLFSTLVAWLAFKEKLSFYNWIGVLLSIGAIALIAYG